LPQLGYGQEDKLDNGKIERVRSLRCARRQLLISTWQRTSLPKPTTSKATRNACVFPGFWSKDYSWTRRRLRPGVMQSVLLCGAAQPGQRPIPILSWMICWFC